MVLRWVVAGVLEAAKGFRRVKGCQDMLALVAAFWRVTRGWASGRAGWAWAATGGLGITGRAAGTVRSEGIVKLTNS